MAGVSRQAGQEGGRPSILEKAFSMSPSASVRPPNTSSTTPLRNRHCLLLGRHCVILQSIEHPVRGCKY